MTSSDSSPATTTTQDKVLLAARLLAAPLFFYSGIGKMLAFGITASRLPGGEGGFGSFLAAGSIVIELGASLALVLGIYTRCAAIVRRMSACSLDNGTAGSLDVAREGPRS